MRTFETVPAILFYEADGVAIEAQDDRRSTRYSAKFRLVIHASAAIAGWAVMLEWFSA